MPPGFEAGVPDINEVSDLRVKFVKYFANPYMNQNPDLDLMVDSSVIDFELMNVLGESLPINISARSNKIGNIQILIPYQPTKKYDS